MTKTVLAFADGFPTPTTGDWAQLAEKALRGADFDDTLVRSTSDGITRGPIFFDAPEGSQSVDHAPRDQHLPWGMRQTLVEATPAAANAAALEDLIGGVSELELRLDPAGKLGLAACDLESLDETLRGVDLSLAPVHLDALNHSTDHANLLITLFARRRLDGDEVSGGLGLAPIELRARQAIRYSDQDFDSVIDLAQLTAAAFPKLKIMRCNASLAFEAGGTEVQELAMLVASGASYMRLLMDAGLEANQAATAIEGRLAVDADIHLGIAKLRAARRIWARMAGAFGASDAASRLSLQTTTSYRMLSATDPWSNLIRVSCAGFAAASGGADTITIRPLTEALGRPTRFGRRIARNLHMLLAEESHLGKVTDPAAGSYLHETLSDKLANAAWQLFQDIETRGGLYDSMKSGWFQGLISAARNSRQQAIMERSETLIGVNKFPDPDPKAVDVDDTWPHLDPEEGAMLPMRWATALEGDA
ncbi:MAG: methylmalonyl-CoA mutase family protein [Maricaulis sp.]|jgi:methylmalonyl-CoA mutase|nr:methylmalonyl-CoA mutase family protein [Maricaulis sp.]MDG2044505.1 methylmalonyl-CoA mutase family protein [Maricaulis sp.]